MKCEYYVFDVDVYDVVVECVVDVVDGGWECLVCVGEYDIEVVECVVDFGCNCVYVVEWLYVVFEYDCMFVKFCFYLFEYGFVVFCYCDVCVFWNE